MMLSIMQQDILKLLSTLKSLRISQIRKLLGHRYNTTEYQCHTMLKQLRNLGKIQIKEDIAVLTYREIDYVSIDAFEISMGLSGGKAQNIKKGCDPFALIFTIEGGRKDTDNIFAVVPVPFGKEDEILYHLQDANPMLTIIFSIEDLEQRGLLEVANDSYFAIKDDTGVYRYYKNGKP